MGVTQSRKIEKINSELSLTTACMAGHEQKLRKLIEEKANVNQCSMSDSKPPLLYAAEGGNINCMKILLENGANPDIEYDHEHIIVNLLLKRQYTACEILLEYKANINIGDEYDNTPLHIACRRGNISAIKFLLENKADINSKNHAYFKPIDLCQHPYTSGTIRYYERHGIVPTISDMILFENKSRGPLYRKNKPKNKAQNKSCRFVDYIQVEKEKECCICLEKISIENLEKGNPKKLSCGHCFHGGCIGEYIIEKRKCPLCRRKIILS